MGTRVLGPATNGVSINSFTADLTKVLNVTMKVSVTSDDCTPVSVSSYGVMEGGNSYLVIIQFYTEAALNDQSVWKYGIFFTFMFCFINNFLFFFCFFFFIYIQYLGSFCCLFKTMYMYLHCPDDTIFDMHFVFFQNLFFSISAFQEITYFFTNLVYSLPHQVFHIPAICHGVHVRSAHF